MLFRVHYEYNEEKHSTDLDAETPEKANIWIRKKFPGAIILKTKILKEK